MTCQSKFQTHHNSSYKSTDTFIIDYVINCVEYVMQYSQCCNGVCIKDLNPITIWISDECQTLHSSIIRAFYKCNAMLLESFTSCINIRNHNANVAKAPRFRITIVILLLRIWFRAPVAAKMQFRLPIFYGIANHLRVDVGEKCDTKKIKSLTVLIRRWPCGSVPTGYVGHYRLEHLSDSHSPKSTAKTSIQGNRASVTKSCPKPRYRMATMPVDL